MTIQQLTTVQWGICDGNVWGFSLINTINKQIQYFSKSFQILKEFFLLSGMGLHTVQHTITNLVQLCLLALLVLASKLISTQTEMMLDIFLISLPPQLTCV